MSAVTFDRVRGQLLGEHVACGLGAGLHDSWRAAIGARRERDARACTLCGRAWDPPLRYDCRHDVISVRDRAETRVSTREAYLTDLAANMVAHIPKVINYYISRTCRDVSGSCRDIDSKRDSDSMLH